VHASALRDAQWSNKVQLLEQQLKSAQAAEAAALAHSKSLATELSEARAHVATIAQGALASASGQFAAQQVIGLASQQSGGQAQPRK